MFLILPTRCLQKDVLEAHMTQVEHNKSREHSMRICYWKPESDSVETSRNGGCSCDVPLAGCATRRYWLSQLQYPLIHERAVVASPSSQANPREYTDSVKPRALVNLCMLLNLNHARLKPASPPASRSSFFSRRLSSDPFHKSLKLRGPFYTNYRGPIRSYEL